MRGSYEVLLPVKDECENLPHLLNSLFSQTIPPRKVTVIDDASTDCTRQILAKINNKKIAKICLNRNIGKQNILSILFRVYEPSADYVIIMDADVVLPDSTSMEKILEKTKRSHIAFTSYDVAPSRDPLWLGFKFSALLLHKINLCQQTHLIGSGALVVISRDIFNKIKMPPGILRDDLFLYLYAKHVLRVRPAYIDGMPILLKHRKTPLTRLIRKLAKANAVEDRLRRFPIDKPPLTCVVKAPLKTFKEFPQGLPIWVLLKVVSTLYAVFS